MRTAVIALFVVVAAASGQAAAQQAPPPAPLPGQAAAGSPFATVKALRCTFTLYVAARWENGEPQAVAGDDQFLFTIEAIDVAARRARVVGATASASVSAFVTGTGLNVIEQTPIGNFILTTVFANGRAGERFVAVHSRHLGDVSAPPGPSQYYGSCELVQ
jgi:hypothetical protein